MPSLADPAVRTFLEQGTRTGKVAFLAADGSPRVTPIWFVLDGETLVFNTGADTPKGKAFRRDPRVALVVDVDEPPYSLVRIEGVVETSDDLDEVRRWATVIGGRYMGADRAEEFGARNGVPGELLVRMVPSKVTANFDVSG